MFRQRMLWFAIVLLILSSLACNAFAGGSVEPSLEMPPPPVTETEMTAVPEDAPGLAPTATLPGAVTDVPLVDTEGNPLLEALVDVNLRVGPGVQYDRDGFLFAGETAPVIGRDPVSGWWKVVCPGRSTGTQCWVSGGTQYTKVTNGTGAPVAAVPPTPTPKPSPTPAEIPDRGTSLAAEGLLVYADEAGLWLMTLDLSQPLPTGGEPVQLAAAEGVERPLISPDGRKIAYIVRKDGANILHVVNLDDGSDQILINSVDLPVNVGDGMAVLISQIEWLNNSQGIAFNTFFTNLVGPDAGKRVDLWTVKLEGTVTERFETERGGGVFALSNINQVILSQQDAIVRANLDGNDAEALVTFDFISTASEYIYYPPVQWAADGNAAYVAIPNADPWSEEANAALWRIPASGPAERLETLPGNILHHPVSWSPDGSQLVYVQQEIDASNPPPVLMLAEGDGRNPIPYTSDTQLDLFGWSPGGAHFLYAGSGEYAVGQAGAPPTKYPAQGAIADMQWLTASTFITAIGGSGSWNLRSNNINGDLDLLTIANNDFADFDVWAP